jgi:hypothetical protein
MPEPKPTGDYADRMIEPDGWPDIDEDTLYKRSSSLTEPLRQVHGLLSSWQTKRNEIFGDPGIVVRWCIRCCRWRCRQEHREHVRAPGSPCEGHHLVQPRGRRSR